MNRNLLTGAVWLSVLTLSGCNSTTSSSVIVPTRVAQDEPPGPTAVFPGTGPEVVAFVAAQYPEKLAAGVSHDERIANMRFLRDRIIEVGRCGGMDLGWNRKRGGPELSIDFIVWRQEGGDRGVDVGLDFDNTSTPLKLYWGEWPEFGASYQAYPETGCQ